MGNTKKTEVKVNTESKILKIKSFFSKQREEKQPEKIWSKFSFGRTTKNEPQGKSAEEARLEAEAEALNNLIRQEEEEKAKEEKTKEEETSVTKPRQDGILKHQHQDTIKEEKETKASQQSIQPKEGKDVQQSVVKSLQHTQEVEEEERNNMSMKEQNKECSNV